MQVQKLNSCLQLYLSESKEHSVLQKDCTALTISSIKTIRVFCLPDKKGKGKCQQVVHMPTPT